MARIALHTVDDVRAALQLEHCKEAFVAVEGTTSCVETTSSWLEKAIEHMDGCTKVHASLLTATGWVFWHKLL